jgi:hypothetical protein
LISPGCRGLKMPLQMGQAAQFVSLEGRPCHPLWQQGRDSVSLQMSEMIDR